jgi:membrane protease subunit HflK
MQEVLSNTTKVVIDQKANSNLLFLPLDKLMQAAAATIEVPNTGVGETAGTSNNTTSESRRTRDAFRSRNRETR